MSRGTATSLLSALRLGPEDVQALVVGDVPASELPRSYEDFLGFASGQHSLLLKPQPTAVSFNQVAIRFWPKAETPEEQTLACENDLADCTRKCEHAYGDRTAEMEEPCKLAVARQFGLSGGSACFPSHATVLELRRGEIPIALLRVGDTIMAEDGGASRVVALLHENRTKLGLYLRLRHAAGALDVSPEHLVRARLVGRRGGDAGSSERSEWSWAAAEDVRPGDALLDHDGEPLEVLSVSRLCFCGAFAPLTVSGALLVNGVLCSCYAPPSALKFSHDTCHQAMLPLRAVAHAAGFVENVTQIDSTKQPLFSLEVKWLSAPFEDPSMHPYAAGLLRLASWAQNTIRTDRVIPDLRQCPAPGIDVFAEA